MTNFQVENGYDPQEMKELLLRQNGLSVSDGESVTDAFETLKKEVAVLRQDNLFLTQKVSELVDLLGQVADRLVAVEGKVSSHHGEIFYLNKTVPVVLDLVEQAHNRLSKLEQEQPDGK